MAAARREGVKQSLLVGFIALNVILILFVWADNLIEKPDKNGFIRSTTGPSATLSDNTSEPQKTPSPHTDSHGLPGAPTSTPKPYRDSGDLGMLQPVPLLYLAGS